MLNRNFVLTDQNLSIIEEIGVHIPGGFFIYKSEEPEELIYANKSVFSIFGCADLSEFKELTGFFNAAHGFFLRSSI